MTTDTLQAERRGFAAVSAVVEVEAGDFAAEIDPQWTVGGKPNGGYLLAMLGRAATSMTGHDHVIAASAHYLRSPEPGPVRIETEPLRVGRSASQARARMEQDGRVCVEALITSSHLDDNPGAYWGRGLPEVSELGYEACQPLAARTPDGRRVAMMEQIDVRLEPDANGFSAGRPSGRGELRGWLALPEGEDFDPTSLLFAADAYPPATFDVEFSGWVPTLELTVYIRALPAPGPLRVLQRAQLIDGGRVDECCFLWDWTGRLVAQGTQLAGIRLG